MQASRKKHRNVVMRYAAADYGPIEKQ